MSVMKSRQKKPESKRLRDQEIIKKIALSHITKSVIVNNLSAVTISFFITIEYTTCL
jgi:hypothetical protein